MILSVSVIMKQKKMKEGEVFKFIISQPSRVEVGALSK